MKTLDALKIVKVADIIPDENQPRKMFDSVKMANLIGSIKKHGIMSPLTLEKVVEKYLLVDGERRFRASKELGLKEVPATIISPQSSIDRLVQQFHIQEQHEGWSATEKASTVYALSKELGVSIEQIGEMLCLERTTLNRYIAFANLVDKKGFERSEINMHWVAPIHMITNLSKKIYDEILEKPYSRETQGKVEKAIIARIKDGEISRPNELTKLKDSFTRNPKSVEEFVDTHISIAELFTKTKAKSAYHLRNVVNSAGYVESHINHYLARPDVLPTENNIHTFKRAKIALDKLLAKLED